MRVLQMLGIKFQIRSLSIRDPYFFFAKLTIFAKVLQTIFQILRVKLQSNLGDD